MLFGGTIEGGILDLPAPDDFALNPLYISLDKASLNDRIVNSMWRTVWVVLDHLLLGDLYGAPEQCPEHAGVTRRGGQGAVVAVVLVQPSRQQRTDVETGHFYSLICKLRCSQYVTL